MPKLADGRKPVVSSDWRGRNPSRPTHLGADIMYLRIESDTQLVGPGEGTPRFVCPDNIPALAVMAGRVQMAGHQPNGWRCWVMHDDGTRSGYFHLKRLIVERGDVVTCGQPLGIVGAGREGARHLHFERRSGNVVLDPMDWIEASPMLELASIVMPA